MRGFVTLGCIIALASIPSSARGDGAQYRVTAGDTLWSLARDHGCTLDTLRTANGIDEDGLRVGQTITIPRCATLPSVTDDVSEGLPQRLGDPLQTVHVVQPGQTLSHIAKLYDVSVEVLQARNRLEGTRIFVGQQLRITDAPVPRLTEHLIQSVGRPQRGRLIDGARLPHDTAYYLRRPERAYATSYVVQHVREVVRAVRRRHPRVHPLAIGDLSRPGGGWLSGHSSHQSGRDVDLGLYFKQRPSGYPEEFVSAHDATLDRAATWELLYALWTSASEPGGPQQVFLDYGVQQMLYEYAQFAGVPSDVLGRILQYPDGRYARDRFVQHEPHHADHFHVRYACPPEQTRCKP